MKKGILITVLLVLCTALLASCGCAHKNWEDASCEVAKTCADCGETEGEPLGHDWVDASCAQPKTCSRCEMTVGDVLDHVWLDATTEAPKTCSGCGLTEGERIITDPRFTTAACQELFGSWAMTVPMTGDMMSLEGFTGVLEVNVFMDFTNDGKITIYTRIDKPEDFDAALREYMTEMVYSEFEASGISREDGNAYAQSSIGMSVEEYVDSILKIIDFSAIFEMMDMDGNYYVEDGNIYAGTSWDEEMTPSSYRFVNGKLVVDELIGSFGELSDGFTRVEEEN